MKTLEEGLVTLALDYAMAIRVIKYLWNGYDKSPAFKLGIIDDEGNLLKSPTTVEEKSAYSPFVRLMFSLKKMIALVPGGSTKIGSLFAAYQMMRECIESEEEQNFLDEILAPVLVNKLTIEESLLNYLREDGAPVNVTSGATSSSTGGYATPINTSSKPKKLISIINRRKPISTLEPTVTQIKRPI